MKRHRAPWDYEQAAEAKRLLDEGVSIDEAAYYLGRTPDGIRKALYNFFGSQRPDPVDRYVIGPAIGKTMECDRIAKDARIGSQVLREACLDLFQRTANRHRVSVEDAMARQLGNCSRPIIPGRAPAPLKTASAQRLAA